MLRAARAAMVAGTATRQALATASGSGARTGSSGVRRWESFAYRTTPKTTPKVHASWASQTKKRMKNSLA